MGPEEFPLFDRLSHHLETSDGGPDDHYQSRFEEVECIEDEHHDPSDRHEARLSQARIHCREGDISAVVDLLQEKYKHR